MSARAISPPHIAEACSRSLRNGRTGYADNHGEKAFREGMETLSQ